MAVRYAALSACRKVHTWRWPISENRSFFYFGCSLVRRFYCKVNNNGTDGQTDRQTDRVRRNMRPPPREEGRIIKMISSGTFCGVHMAESLSLLLILLVVRNFVSGICKLKPKTKNLIQFCFVFNVRFFQPSSLLLVFFFFLSGLKSAGPRGRIPSLERPDPWVTCE